MVDNIDAVVGDRVVVVSERVVIGSCSGDGVVVVGDGVVVVCSKGSLLMEL